MQLTSARSDWLGFFSLASCSTAETAAAGARNRDMNCPQLGRFLIDRSLGCLSYQTTSSSSSSSSSSLTSFPSFSSPLFLPCPFLLSNYRIAVSFTRLRFFFFCRRFLRPQKLLLLSFLFPQSFSVHNRVSYWSWSVIDGQTIEWAPSLLRSFVSKYPIASQRMMDVRDESIVFDFFFITFASPCKLKTLCFCFLLRV